MLESNNPTRLLPQKPPRRPQSKINAVAIPLKFVGYLFIDTAITIFAQLQQLRKMIKLKTTVLNSVRIFKAKHVSADKSSQPPGNFNQIVVTMLKAIIFKPYR